MTRSVGFVAAALVAMAVGMAAGGEFRQVSIDLQPKANQALNQTFPPGDYPGDSLAELPTGEQRFGGVRFFVGPKLIQLAGKFLQDHPMRVEGLKVSKPVQKLHILHAARWGAYGGRGDSLGHWVPDGTPIAYYEVVYADRTSEAIPVIYGVDVRDWWSVWDHEKPTKQGRVVWKGTNEHLRQRPEAKYTQTPLRLYLTTWENPRPEVPVVSIDLVSVGQVPALFCVAITAESPARDYEPQVEALEKKADRLKQEIDALKKEIRQGN